MRIFSRGGRGGRRGGRVAGRMAELTSETADLSMTEDPYAFRDTPDSEVLLKFLALVVSYRKDRTTRGRCQSDHLRKKVVSIRTRPRVVSQSMYLVQISFRL